MFENYFAVFFKNICVQNKAWVLCISIDFAFPVLWQIHIRTNLGVLDINFEFVLEHIWRPIMCCIEKTGGEFFGVLAFMFHRRYLI